MTFLMYATVWAALALYVAAEAGRARRGGAAWWAWRAWTIGGLLMAVHVVLALGVRYGWDHDLAVRETARQAAALYGFEWRGSIFVSYAFVALWLLDAWLWRVRGAGGVPGPLVWLLRAFVFIVIFNGAVVFARPGMRPLGIVLVAGLLWVWLTTARRRPALPADQTA